MLWYPSGIFSHAWLVSGIPPLGGIWVLGSCRGCWNGTLDRICLPESLRRCTSKVTILHMGIPQRMIMLCFGEDVGRGGVSSQERLSWCVWHTIGNSGGWESVRNSRDALSCIFDGQETAELEAVAVYQCGLSREVATLHIWVAVMIKTGDG